MEGMVPLESLCCQKCRRQLGCCSLALPSPPCHGPHARASSCPLKPMVFLTPSLVFHLVFIPSPLSGLSCPGNDSPVSSTSHYTPVVSELTLALVTTHSLSWVPPKHLPLHRACIAPHPISFRGETNPSSSAGHSSPANGLGPVPGAVLSPTAPVVPLSSTSWRSCWVPSRAVDP